MHECSESKYKGYEIHLANENDYPYLYDKQTHQYVFRINFCPFCGEAL